MSQDEFELTPSDKRRLDKHMPLIVIGLMIVLVSLAGYALWNQHKHIELLKSHPCDLCRQYGYQCFETPRFEPEWNVNTTIDLRGDDGNISR